MDALPALIGRYQIRQQLGQGGMGVLYLAFDPTMDRLVALKLLRVNDAQWRERFLREARLVARLQHPNIITIHDVGSFAGQPFMAMEYIAGNTLDTIVRRRVPMSAARKLEIMIALCDGLAYAHRSGVIHRDIKPTNLIVHRDSGLLKVLDFGIARTNDSSLTLAGSIMGTPNYMSPEQVRGKVIDHRSDVFAVGVVLYELFAHRQAFSGDTAYLVLQDIVHRMPERLATVDPSLDPRLDAIVSRAIAKDPEDRYPDLDVMRRDLIEALRHTEPEEREQAGREKTMVLLARAAGSDRVMPVPADRLAVLTPPPMMRTPSGPVVPTPVGNRSGRIDEADDEVDANGETSVIPTPAPSALENIGNIDTEVERPAGWRGLDPVESERRFARLGMLVAAAVLVLIVLPVFFLTSWRAAPPSAPRATRGPVPLSATPLRSSIAPTASATATVPADSIAAVLEPPAHPVSSAEPESGALRGIEPRTGVGSARGGAITTAPPVPAEPPAGKSDLKAMQDTLNRWKDGYERRDVAAVSRVWPTISATQAKSFDAAFDRMSKATVLFRQCSLAGSVARGSASCRVERTIVSKTGRTENISSQMTFDLEKRAGRWLIVGVRGA